ILSDMAHLRGQRQALPRPPAALSVSPHRPRPGADGGKVEKYEAEQHRRLAVVLGREEALREVHEEIADCHKAREDEGDWTREKTDRDQKTADELHRSGEVEQSRRHLVDERQTRRKAQQLAGS